MPNITQIIKFRNQRLQRASSLSRLGRRTALFASLFMATVAVIGLAIYSTIKYDLPSVSLLPSLLDPPTGLYLQPSRIYDRTYQHVILTLENPGAKGRQYLKVGANGETGADYFSPYLVKAAISKLDPNFWKHAGYTVWGLVRGTQQTIAQRLVSNLLLEDEPDSIRKDIRERLLAAQITQVYGREKVMEWYLNSTQLGQLIYGMDAAARVYFGKSASNLTLAEAAMLVAIYEEPQLNPALTPQVLKSQQQQIILLMFTNGSISVDEMEAATSEELHFRQQPKDQGLAPAFTNLVKKQLASVEQQNRVLRGGYDIISTLDYDLQLQANCMMKIQAASVATLEGLQTNEDGTVCEAAQYLTPIPEEDRGKFSELKTDIVILDPAKGQILAMVVNRSSDTDSTELDAHPTGTILTPFMYLSAFSRGMNTGSLLWDIPESQDSNLAPSSMTDLAFYHGPVRARVALVNDYLTAGASVFDQVGWQTVEQTAHHFGITMLQTQSGEMRGFKDLLSQPGNLLEITAAYGVLANQGTMVGHAELKNVNQEELEPIGILRVVRSDGRILLDWSQAQSRSIVSPQLAYLLTNVLSDEKSKQEGSSNLSGFENGQQSAVKIGSTTDKLAAWAVGYTPQIAVGVWMGEAQSNEPLANALVSGLWRGLMEYSTARLPRVNFTIPTGISFVQVCNPSGLLVTPICPAIVQEVFLSENEPTEEDNLYQKVQINRETGLLASAFTLPELVEDKVFLIVPPKAEVWATKTGLPLPPDTYDDIDTAQTGTAEVNITSPVLFDMVRGKVSIRGSAGGPDFDYYRLEVGQGMNPHGWIQLGENHNQAASDIQLGEWNTNGLDGIYIIQLLVVRKDKKVDRAMLQVTVDNTVPQIKIIEPANDEKLTYHQGNTIMMQAEVTDDSIVKQVDFYVDGKLQRSRGQPPYVIAWPGQPGEHYLQVRATDQAGNVAETSVIFSLEK